jgi:hypothetical protein
MSNSATPLGDEAAKAVALPESNGELALPANMEWQTEVSESGTVIDFPQVGDQFVGLFIGRQIAKGRDGGEFKILQFIGPDKLPYQHNAGAKLEAAFEEIPTQSLVRITRTPDIDTGRPSAMRDFRIDVAVPKQ